MTVNRAAASEHVRCGSKLDYSSGVMTSKLIKGSRQLRKNELVELKGRLDGTVSKLQLTPAGKQLCEILSSHLRPILTWAKKDLLDTSSLLTSLFGRSKHGKQLVLFLTQATAAVAYFSHFDTFPDVSCDKKSRSREAHGSLDASVSTFSEQKTDKL